MSVGGIRALLLLNRTWQSAEMLLLSLYYTVVTSDPPADLSVASPLAHLDEKAATEERPRGEELRAASGSQPAGKGGRRSSGPRGPEFG